MDPDLGGPKTCGSGSATLPHTMFSFGFGLCMYVCLCVCNRDSKRLKRRWTRWSGPVVYLEEGALWAENCKRSYTIWTLLYIQNGQGEGLEPQRDTLLRYFLTSLVQLNQYFCIVFWFLKFLRWKIQVTFRYFPIPKAAVLSVKTLAAKPPGLKTLWRDCLTRWI